MAPTTLRTIDANALAASLVGDTIYANVSMVGAAWQLGLVPVSLKALLRAIELNGVKIEENQAGIYLGPNCGGTIPTRIEPLARRLKRCP